MTAPKLVHDSEATVATQVAPHLGPVVAVDAVRSEVIAEGDHPVDLDKKLLVVPGFGEIVVGAGLERLDRPALGPLPGARYEIAQWKDCRVNIDYHVEIEHNYYSVPYQLVHEALEARFTATTVELYRDDHRIASHRRLYGRGQVATKPEHMPSAHRAHAQWTPSRLIGWAEKTGPATGRLVAGILRSRPHPEQGYRACLGLIRLAKVYGAEEARLVDCRDELVHEEYEHNVAGHLRGRRPDPVDEVFDAANEILEQLRNDPSRSALSSTDAFSVLPGTCQVSDSSRAVVSVR